MSPESVKRLEDMTFDVLLFNTTDMVIEGFPSLFFLPLFLLSVSFSLV